MGEKNRALGENEFKAYHQGIVKALKEKAFRSEVQPYIGESAPEDSRISIWFDTTNSEVMVMSVSDESEDLTFNETCEEELIFNEEEEELIFNEEEEELTFNEEVKSEPLTFNNEE